MSRTPDVDLVLREYFADDGASAPDRVLDVVEDRISRQPQRRAWPFPGRTTVSNQVKLIAGLAAVLVVAVVGWQLLPVSGGIGSQPIASPSPAAIPSPTAAPSPSAAPTLSAVLPSWYTTSDPPTGPGILAAGSHTTMSFEPGFTFSVPDGWVNDTDSTEYFGLFPDTPANQAEFAQFERIAHGIFMGLHPSPWFTCESAENNAGATAAEMVAAAVANEALIVSEPLDVSIGGLTGKQVDVRRNPDWTGTCPEDASFPAGADPEDERPRGVLLDVPGRGVLVMFIGSTTPTGHEAFLAEAMPIVESFQFSQ